MTNFLLIQKMMVALVVIFFKMKSNKILSIEILKLIVLLVISMLSINQY